jgi:fatty acid-binding protein DegV
MERILTEMARDVGALPVHATVIHADAPGEAEELHARIEREFNTVELFVSQFAPFMGAHTGPGLVGVSFWAER